MLIIRPSNKTLLFWYSFRKISDSPINSYCSYLPSSNRRSNFSSRTWGHFADSLGLLFIRIEFSDSVSDFSIGFTLISGGVTINIGTVNSVFFILIFWFKIFEGLIRWNLHHAFVSYFGFILQNSSNASKFKNIWNLTSNFSITLLEWR